MASVIPPHQVCFKCGASLDVRARFCPDCGSALRPPSKANGLPDLSRVDNRPVIKLVVAVAVLFALLAFILNPRTSSSSPGPDSAIAHLHEYLDGQVGSVLSSMPKRSGDLRFDPDDNADVDNGFNGYRLSGKFSYASTSDTLIACSYSATLEFDGASASDGGWSIHYCVVHELSPAETDYILAKQP